MTISNEWYKMVGEYLPDLKKNSGWLQKQKKNPEAVLNASCHYTSWESWHVHPQTFSTPSPLVYNGPRHTLKVPNPQHFWETKNSRPVWWHVWTTQNAVFLSGAFKNEDWALTAMEFEDANNYKNAYYNYLKCFRFRNGFGRSHAIVSKFTSLSTKYWFIEGSHW